MVFVVPSPGYWMSYKAILVCMGRRLPYVFVRDVGLYTPVVDMVEFAERSRG